jgi:hypothetical protein
MAPIGFQDHDIDMGRTGSLIYGNKRPPERESVSGRREEILKGSGSGVGLRFSERPGLA